MIKRQMLVLASAAYTAAYVGRGVNRRARAWIDLDPLNNLDAPRTPFDLEEYRNANLEEGAELSQLAESILNDGKQANQNSDDFILAVVFFASVLFFGGIAPKFRAVWVRAVVVLLATGGLGFAAWQIATLPYH